MIFSRTSHLILLLYAMSACFPIKSTSSPASQEETEIIKKRKAEVFDQAEKRSKLENQSIIGRILNDQLWADTIHSWPEDEILPAIVNGFKGRPETFNELQILGELYFKQVPSQERFYTESNGKITLHALHRFLSQFRCLRECVSDVKKRSGQEINSQHAELINGLKNDIVSAAKKFRPYAIALALRNSLWPKNEPHAPYLKAPLTTDSLTTLWATGSADSYELNLEKVCYLTKAYELYFDVSKQYSERNELCPLDIPSFNIYELVMLMPAYSISSLEKPESIDAKLKKYFILEDTIVEILLSHLRCLMEHHEYPRAAETHSLLRETIENNIARLATTKRTVREMLAPITEKADKKQIDHMLAQLWQREIQYGHYLTDRISAGTPYPCPSPLLPSPRGASQQITLAEPSTPSPEAELGPDSDDSDLASSSSSTYSFGSPKNLVRSIAHVQCSP